MRVFVAGGTGAVGRPLVARLAATGHEVTVFTRDESRVRALGLTGVQAAVGDALDAASLTRAVVAAAPEVVVNQLTNLPQTASPRAVVRGFARTGRLRRETSAVLVAAAQQARARRVIAQSISFLYRPGPGVRTEVDPLWTDARGMVGRLSAPLAALESVTLDTEGLEGVVLRYGLFYGPGTAFDRGGMFATFVARRMYPVARSDGARASFIHVDDAASATVAALEGPTGIYNVVDDVPAAASEWVPLVASLLGAKPPRRVPDALLRLGGGYGYYTMCQQPAVSNARVKGELGWAPIYADWRDGFRAVLGGKAA